MDKYDQFVQLLKNEINLINQLYNLLLLEKDKLYASDLAALEPIADKKNNLAIQVEQSIQAKKKVLNCQTNSNDDMKKALQLFLTHYSEEENSKIKELNEELQQVIARCRDQNLVNGQVIVSNMAYRQTMLNTLKGSTKQPSSIYSAMGTIEPPKSDDRHTEV